MSIKENDDNEDQQSSMSFILIKPRAEGNKEPETLKLYAKDQDEKRQWVNQLKRTMMNAATHGIEIQSMKIQDSNVKATIKEKGGSEESALELSVWDFAGQHDYYHNHHY